MTHAPDFLAADGARLTATRFAPAPASSCALAIQGALGVPAIGHFGFPREHFRATLWREAVD